MLQGWQAVEGVDRGQQLSVYAWVGQHRFLFLLAFATLHLLLTRTESAQSSRCPGHRGQSRARHVASVVFRSASLSRHKSQARCALAEAPGWPRACEAMPLRRFRCACRGCCEAIIRS
eukprot:3544535-Alexandrium_andersonii.AAC.1